MIKLNDLIDKLYLAKDLPNYYKSGGWGIYNTKTQKWGWDCNNLFKGIYWGWVADTSKPKGGGATKGSGGLGDIGETTLFNQCYEITTDFSTLKKGEFIWMKGHIGYVVDDNRNVIEATRNHTFNADGVIKSQVGSKGERLYNGKQSGSWLKHGYSPYVDYGNTYIVKGDTLEGIAKEYKVSVQAIIEVNNITDGRLYVGQELIIPDEKQYTIINAKSGVWSRLDGYGLDKPKFKLIPYQTKCILLQKDYGTADGYNWDKIVYDNKTVYIPNKWSLYE